MTDIENCMEVIRKILTVELSAENLAAEGSDQDEDLAARKILTAPEPAPIGAAGAALPHPAVERKEDTTQTPDASAQIELFTENNA
ncbi:MAG: hypothetical protein LBP78_04680, partial [Acidaminococcales bacterium]|jgi:hypothetical protein|nr:hypothetical protein [Acidaminococcales bacterium]